MNEQKSGETSIQSNDPLPFSGDPTQTELVALTPESLSWVAGGPDGTIVVIGR